MPLAAWIFMLLAWSAVITLVVFCYWKILKKRGRF